MALSAIPSCDRLWINARLATLEPAGGLCGARLEHAIGVRDGKIAAIVPMATHSPLRAPTEGWSGEGQGVRVGSTETASDRPEIIDLAGAWITPGFVDCHTHLVYGGNRVREIEMRRRGVAYAEIARQGGGILSTVRATRALSESQLVDAALPRLHALMAEGVTTVEIKSGYGLTLEDELKMLRAARQLGSRLAVNVTTTLLAAHAVPPEYAGRADDYVTLICDEIIPAAAAEHLADAVDVFCENIAFSPAQCRRVFEAAQQHGLPVKGHMEQLSSLGGSQLAAQFKALSVDHLEHLDADGVRAIAASGTVAVLLPGATYFLRETRKPPIELLRSAGVPMAVATDLNPGTCPLASIRLMMNMASTLFGLSFEEALIGVTRAAAQAVGLADRVGTLSIGKQADFLVWDIGDPAELVCEFGVHRPRQRVFRGDIT
jgi:imidazolonepropionase